MTRLTPGTVVEVAIPLPLPGLFSYVLPADMRAAARPGSRLRVPFGPRKLVGYLVRESLGKSTEGLKTVLALIDDEPLIGAQFLDLAIRMARRYAAGPGEVLAAFLPAAVKKGARGRRTILVRAVPVAAARALADLGDSDRLTARRAVLQALLDAEDGLPRTLLERRLGISSSPMKTLERAGLITFEEVEEREDLFARLDIRPTHAPSLMSDQVQAASAIGRAIEDSRYAGFLLHGVTGSGKTEVYLDAIGRCVAKGRGAIILVPEIALTPQTVERFESRFGSVAVLHSRLTDSERAAQWEEIRRGTKRIAIGPRSAVFAPVDPLGLI
ncbi:MAG: DEAD/DEAH box helicase family protein, partial [Planctomycetes bacterium]|nr:DEAD/DEAH box helicase family protein [Planctomycetota bacterium]